MANTSFTPEQDHEGHEFHIRKAALDAAVEWAAGPNNNGGHVHDVVNIARYFETYLRTGENFAKSETVRFLRQGRDA